MTMAMAAGPSLENSGSLTGHILAQGWADDSTPRGNTAKVLLIMALVLGVLIAVGVLVVFAAGDTFGNLFDGLLNG